MKILLVNTLFPPNIVGGAEISVFNLASSLHEEGIDVTVLSLLNPEQNQEVGPKNGFKSVFMPLSNLYFPFKKKTQHSPLARGLWHFGDSYNYLMSNKFKRFLSNNDFDLVHTNNLCGFSVSLWNQAIKYSIPVVHTLRDYYLACPRSTLFHNNKECNKQCLIAKTFSLPRKWLSSKVQAVVGISQFILEKHLELGYFKLTPIKLVIPNQVNDTTTHAFEPTIEKSADDVLRIGYLGRLSSEKGIDLLLETFSTLPSDHFELHIGGNGEPSFVNNLHKENTHHPNMIFHGFVEPTHFFKNIDVLVVPSLWNEPFGRIVIEAYSHGIPVICSIRGGLPELVRNGETGYLFDPELSISLRNLLLQISENKNILPKLRLNCYQETEQYRSSNISMKYISLYEQLL